MRDAAAVVAFIADQDKRKHDADAQAGRLCGGQRDEHRGMAAARVAGHQLVRRRVRVAAYHRVMGRGWDDGTRSSVSIRNLVREDRIHLEAD
jgi:hypothetical protein